MTDQIFYEELRATVRDAIASYLDTYTDEELRELATESLSLPFRPTLADMTEEERAACQWMQADVKGYESRVVIVNPYWADGIARVMWLHTRMNPVSWKSVTPRPDLPRLEWPSDQGVEDVPALPAWGELADHPKHGKVIVIDPTPDSDGRIRVMRPIPGRPEYKWFLCEPSELTYTYTEGHPND